MVRAVGTVYGQGEAGATWAHESCPDWIFYPFASIDSSLESRQDIIMSPGGSSKGPMVLSEQV